MSVLRVVRPDDRGGRYRDLLVEVDGHEVAALRPNREVAVELPAGRHVVIGRMDWVRSADLLVELESETTSKATVELSLPFRAIIDTVVRPKRAIRARRLE